ncbi:hypothetical protein BUALT_Bualt10G0003300 [Buddleja alternifolia]|uniref:Protein FAR1-RELATED SEQUENCE n=1 Tax=Buddleja alternifolia TaxID=168488 RepID=A0AAV6WVX9_9LAMI|nr:hypothetical protein BUALT_Bualt10G0003300 [Buddleja alternifolia]
MPFSPFVGFNHHGKSVLIGCGLLADEITETFVWWFNSWLTFMGRLTPRAIINDQCKAIQIEISQVCRRFCHRLCLWHLIQKVHRKLNGYNEYKSIKHAMEVVVYDLLTMSEFEQARKEMIDNHGLRDNEWLQPLCDDKEKWIPVFLKISFFRHVYYSEEWEHGCFL